MLKIESHMKFLIGMLFILSGAQVAVAGQCRVNSGPLIDVFNNAVSISATVQAIPGDGKILLGGYTLECRYTPWGATGSNSTDYWKTNWNPLVPGPKFTTYRAGLSIRGVDYWPTVSGVDVATMKNYGAGSGGWVNLNTYMFLRTVGVPSHLANIRAGDLVGTMNFRQTNNTGDPPADVKVYILARNDFYFNVSTCTINGDMPIFVDFNDVDPTAIGENSVGSSIQKTISLAYSCPDPGVTTAITITLKGSPASFNSSLLRTSNPGIGVGLLRAGLGVAPETSFGTTLSNSVGSDNVVFSLVRQPGSFPAAGLFTASATLIMGLP